MTGSTPLDVAIALIFIYLLYSLLASTIAEALADIFRWRVYNLRYYVRLMLTDEVAPFRIWHWFKKPKPNADLAHAFFQFPSIQNLTRKRTNDTASGPSYLDANTFTEGLIDLLVHDRNEPSEWERLKAAILNGTADQTIDPKTGQHLLRLLQKSNNNLETFRQHVGQWFEATMARCGSNYKQWMQRVLVVTGLALAAGFNVDSIQLAKKLASDAALSASMATMASQASEASSADALKDKVNPYLEQANQSLGLGWGQNPFSKNAPNPIPLTLLGWCISALAISLGAPFWFDLLNKLVKLRSAVPDSADSTKAKST